MNNKQTTSYLLWVFLLAWALQAAAIVFAWNARLQEFRLITAVMMFAPFIATLLAKIPLAGMGWRLHLRSRWKWFFAAWFGFAVLAALGGALYYLLFPKALDLSDAYLEALMGEAQIQQYGAQGMTIQKLKLVSLTQALTYAPFINALLAIGEEVGWRGALYPRLKTRFGIIKGRLLGGLIWGIWHWPIMILAGYNYGTDYWGAPVLGPLVFCMGCVAIGVLIDLMYEKTECIWIPALAHGAFNAISNIPMLFLNPDYINRVTLGPIPISLIGGVPMFLLAFLMIGKSGYKAAGTGKPSL